MAIVEKLYEERNNLWEQMKELNDREISENRSLDSAEKEQWEDYQTGVQFGWKLSKSIGIFVEGEYTKFWDSKIYNSSVGLNITLK